MFVLLQAAEIALTAVAAVALLLSLHFTCQILASLLPRRATLQFADRRQPFTLIIPAHDEEAGIARTLGFVMPQLEAGDRAIVVADNCSDDTAAKSAGLGAEVTVRVNKQLTGKGYALQHGLNYAAQAGKAGIIIFLDADCELALGTLSRLAATAGRLNRPVQAAYLMQAPTGASPVTRLSEFAWIIKNYARPLGAQRLGFPCQLMGSGMAFPWPTLDKIDFATGHLAEDLKIGADLALQGEYVLFCPEAEVTSEFAASDQGHQIQRVRWEHGHLSMIGSHVPRMLLSAFKRRSASLGWIALDICVPPVVSLAFLTFILIGLAGLFAVLTGKLLPLAVAALAFFALSVGVLVGVARWGGPALSFRYLLTTAPLYALRKLAVSSRFVRKRETKWIRSER